MAVRKVKKANSAKKALEGKRVTKKVDIKEAGKTVNQVEIPGAKPPLMDGIIPNSTGKVPPAGFATIASGLGVTLNMDNYQSARLDVYIMRNVPDDEKVIQDEYEKMHKLVNAEIEAQSEAVFEMVEE
ncbi:hypothetical protein F400_gp067 [Bacillus phage BCD7]|uniref:Uncharacterized protein n=1 Tax=Bacillus phage BCD7 TaxID=1136534 RepID=J9PV81_9CAUD|nr:hypothetical protein F400_gp067 [Bacillus phage BCD7]AEZ50514.1 hypothetical protein BCD7_0067 [Bacillus phage BCD7]